MNDIEYTNRHVHNPDNSSDQTERKRRTHRQKTSPSPEAQPTPTGGNPLASLDLHQPSSTSANRNNNVVDLTLPSTSSAKAGAGNSNSLPGHQSGRSKLNNPRLIDQQTLNVSDNLHGSGADGDHDLNDSLPSSLLWKRNLSTSDLDPSERKKQAALAKVEAKLEKAQRLHQKAQQSVEQEISDFLRVTTVPNTTNEAGSARATNATFDKRIKTLQDTKKELEKKIANYQTDISRIQAGEIPHNYSSSKDILSNIKSTAAKVTGGSLKHRSTNNNDQTSTLATLNTSEHAVSSHHQPESDGQHHPHNTTSPTTSATPTITTPTNAGGGGNHNHQHSPFQNQHNNAFEPTHSSLSSSTSNEIGNSQFYIDSSHEYIYDSERSNRKQDNNNTLSADATSNHDHEKSPSLNRRPIDDADFNDRISDHSIEDRHSSSASKRQTSATGAEYQQLSIKVDFMQKIIDRYDSKMSEMQKQLDSLVSVNELQREKNERLNNELTDLIDLHQVEMSTIKTDLKNLEQRLVYKFNDYWNELLEKLDKIDTRTAKVEQTQTHSHETEENTHRIISKLVNILLTVFAIILLLLSTIKNLVQSRIHAMTLLILAIIWITLHYFPQNYFQTSFFKNFTNIFKRAS